MDIESLAPRLRSYLTDVENGEIKQAALAELINLTRSAASSYIRIMRRDAAGILKESGFTIDDLAIDSCGEIFGSKNGENLYQIRRFISSLSQPLDKINTLSVWSAFFAFVRRVVDVNISRIFSQIDPAGSKLARNLKENLKRSKELYFLKTEASGYVFPKGLDSLNSLPEYPLEKLQKDISRYKPGNAKISDFLNAIYQILADQEEYRRVIPFNVLVNLLKKINVQINADLTEDQFSFEHELISNLDREIMLRQVEKVVSEKILSSYLLKGKVNESEAKTLYLVIIKVVEDWLSDEISDPGLYGVLKMFVSVDQMEYEKFWRVKLEYLLRVAREVLVNLIDT
ncbi:MAG: hypothetical protein ACP5US_09200 [Candidatus Kryptoniota bacterium]